MSCVAKVYTKPTREDKRRVMPSGKNMAICEIVTAATEWSKCCYTIVDIDSEVNVIPSLVSLVELRSDVDSAKSNIRIL
ncbi:unnamed protein product [Rhizophagus irregularis]|nr:unnamed protein product [Rhizophagus irregularis]